MGQSYTKTVDHTTIGDQHGMFNWKDNSYQAGKFTGFIGKGKFDISDRVMH